MRTFLYTSVGKIRLFEKTLFLFFILFVLVLFLGSKNYSLTPFRHEIKKRKQVMAILTFGYGKVLMDGAVIASSFQTKLVSVSNDLLQFP